MKEPRDYDTPVIERISAAIRELAAAHEAAAVENAHADAGLGLVGLARVRGVLVLSAHGAAAQRIERLLEAANVAQAEVVE